MPPTEAVAPLITEPAHLLAFLAGIVGLVFWLSTLRPFQTFFRYLPPLIWMYFLPMIATTMGITPDDSPLYSPVMSRILLPAVLVLLLIPSDIRGIAKLGPKAVLMMVAGTFGIVLGATVSFWIFKDKLPEESWKAVAALSGSWIGGSPNMTAVIESLDMPKTLVAPIVIVDTVLAYSWLGLLIALSAYQRQIDKHHKADARVIDELAAHLEAEQATQSRAPRTGDIAMMVGLALVVSQICIWLGGPINLFFTKVLGFKQFGEVINAFGWGILLITAVGLALSTTPVRRLDFCGASAVGNVGLYLLLTSYGARANLNAILEAPMFVAMGAVWIAIHVAVLYAATRLLKAPIFLAATASMANIGGTASAPVVAAAYHPSMAPVGLLMAILGGVLGTPLALFVVAATCKAISQG